MTIAAIDLRVITFEVCGFSLTVAAPDIRFPRIRQRGLREFARVLAEWLRTEGLERCLNRKR